MSIITVPNKIDMSCDFHIKHNMHAVERKIIMITNKDKTLMNKLNRPWRQPVFRKYSIIRFNK